MSDLVGRHGELLKLQVVLWTSGGPGLPAANKTSSLTPAVLYIKSKNERSRAELLPFLLQLITVDSLWLLASASPAHALSRTL